MGRGKTSEMALRVTRRVAEDDSTPRYQSPTRVLSRPKARMAMATPTTVRTERSLWRKALRMISFKINIRSNSATETQRHGGKTEINGITIYHEDAKLNL